MSDIPGPFTVFNFMMSVCFTILTRVPIINLFFTSSTSSTDKGFDPNAKLTYPELIKKHLVSFF